MPVFDFQFTVNAPLTAVREFHDDTMILKKLTPPPIFAQIHHYEPLAEGSRATFTLWFGPIPIHWTAVHHHVNAHGFTDQQERGPLKSWKHTHRFTAVDATTTRIHEYIRYDYHHGRRGWLARLLFNKPGLTLLFTARKLLTRYYIKQIHPQPATER